MIDEYCRRINYRGPRSDTVAVLNALILAHTIAIPFENVDVLRAIPISLVDDAIWEKLVVQKRGGYCFEQNGLLLRVLAAWGFQVTALSGRVRVDRNRDMVPWRSVDRRCGGRRPDPNVCPASTQARWQRHGSGVANPT
jgi:N-hydroxyarylamine O-acetyltransferase